MVWSDTKEYKALRARWYNLKQRFPDTVWQTYGEWFAEVGLAPARNYSVRKIRDDLPMGPGNWQWVKVVHPSKKPNTWNTKTKAGKAAYDKHLRAQDPRREHRFHVLRQYGLTSDQYDQMLVNQNGACAICKQPETLKKQGKIMRLNVDHCHKTGRVRGLLCTRCNRGMGLLGDDAQRLRAAAEYIESQTVSAGVTGEADFRRQREVRLPPAIRRN